MRDRGEQYPRLGVRRRMADGKTIAEMSVTVEGSFTRKEFER